MVPGARRKGKKNKLPPAIASSNRWEIFAEDDDENDHEDEHEDEGEGKGAKGELISRFYWSSAPSGARTTLSARHAAFVWSVNIFPVPSRLCQGRGVLCSR